MSKTLDKYQYRELEFAKDGKAVHAEQAAAVGQLASKVSDVIVISHGWNNDAADARALYERVAKSIETLRTGVLGPKLKGRTIGIVGVQWPSKRFADKDITPGGGAAGVNHADPSLAKDLVAFGTAFGDRRSKDALRKAAKLVPDLDRSPAAQREYADLLRSLLSKDGAEPADAIDQFLGLDGDDVMKRLEAAALDARDDLPSRGAPGSMGGGTSIPTGGLSGGGTGAAADLPFGLGDLPSKGRLLLNFVTYYEMKNRAGSIGAGSVAPILAKQVVGKSRMHLVGHSFGARLVTAAADALPKPRSVQSMSLLQAAFSHNAFAKDWQPGDDGAYRRMITSHNVVGPVVITHTRNDVAVGLAYAMASRVAGQNNSAIGDPDSEFGGLGSNGAQHTPEALDDQALGDVDTVYAFKAGKVHNLLADKYVAGHSDVSGVQVINAVLQAVVAKS